MNSRITCRFCRLARIICRRFRALLGSGLATCPIYQFTEHALELFAFFPDLLVHEFLKFFAVLGHRLADRLFQLLLGGVLLARQFLSLELFLGGTQFGFALQLLLLHLLAQHCLDIIGNFFLKQLGFLA